MILQQSRSFQNASDLLVQITIRLQKLSESKSQFVLNLNGRIDRLYERLIQYFDNESITVQKFSQRFTLNESYLQQVLFHQYRQKIYQLTVERLCNYLRIKSTSLISRKNHPQLNNINFEQITKQFVQIVRSQIQILAETRQYFVRQFGRVDKIFQQIDFFNNQYIDCASLVEFFRHYSPGEQFSQVGCSLLIKMIKGSEFSNDKFFFEDLVEFIEKKHLINRSAQLSGEVKHNTINHPPSNPFSSQNMIQNSPAPVQQKPQLAKKRLTLLIHGVQRIIRRQSSIDRSLQQQYDSKFMDLSMSESSSSFLSNKSIQNNNNNNNTNIIEPVFDIALSKISSRVVGKKDDNNPNHNRQFAVMNTNDEVTQLFQVVKQSNQSGEEQEDGKIMQQSEMKKKNQKLVVAGEIMKEKFSIFQQQPLHVKFKGLYQQKHQSNLNPLSSRQHNSKATGLVNKNVFETTLTRTHSRNQAYLAEIKLQSANLPHTTQQHNSSTFNYNNQKNSFLKVHHLLSYRISQFERKKIELIYSMQLISLQFDKWYQCISELIQHNERFNFTNAFNVIDLRQSNMVTLGEFVQFLQQCEIEKISQKIEVFFNCFSKTIVVGSQVGQQLLSSSQSRIQQRVMRFSNFLRMFYLNRTFALVAKCRSRVAKIQMRWDQNMRLSYCNFFKIVIDAVWVIQKIKSTAKLAYLQMKQVWNQMTFEKTFGSDVVGLEQMERVLGAKSVTLMNEVDPQGQQIDQQKLMRFLGIIG